MSPAKSKCSVLRQICKFIPRNLVPILSRKHEVDKKSRSFTPWSHVVSMLYAQLAHSLSLNDIADSLKNHDGALSTIRQATPPSRNGLSHANKERSADMMEELFWETLKQLQERNPSFGSDRKYSFLPHRFKRTVSALDSTTIQLVANSIDWAKHRRRKAAAKCHMQLDLQTFLPRYAIVKAANTHDSTEAVELCSNLKDGEIAVFDKAYIDFKHLLSLTGRGVFWVTRAKDNMRYKVMGQHKALSGKIKRDDIIELTGQKSGELYPEKIRLIEADVKVDGKIRTMTFITNNFEWAASSICDLYKARWAIEVFFKQIKQTLQLSDFLGYSENAVRWQVWSAMLAYLLLRFISFISKWKGSFRRMFTLLRGVIFSRLDMYSVIELCGTAHDPPKMIATPQQAFLPGLEGFIRKI